MENTYNKKLLAATAANTPKHPSFYIVIIVKVDR